MTAVDIEKLLEPLSEETPSGPDLEYDPEFGEMERAAQGKNEQQFGDTVVAAEPPDWKGVHKIVSSLLERTRDLRVGVFFTRSSLNLDGIPGLEVGLRLLRGYIETLWDSVHPELDHSDNDDPIFRTNTLVALCDAEALLRELHDAPLVASRAIGRFSLRDYERAQEASGSDEEGADSSAPKMSTIEAAFTDSDPETLQAVEQATRLAQEHVTAIEQTVTEHVGVGNAISLAPLQTLLKQMNGILAAQLERRGVYTADAEPAAEDQSGEAGGEAGGAATVAVAAANFSGRIETREQVLKALDSVCDFYERNEPSSPVPLLIRRAKRLASKSFLDILRDLAPDAVSQAEAWGGERSASEGLEESGEAEY